MIFRSYNVPTGVKRELERPEEPMDAPSLWMIMMIAASGWQAQMPTQYFSAEDCQAAAQAIAQAHPGSRGTCVAVAAPPGLVKQQGERDWGAKQPGDK